VLPETILSQFRFAILGMGLAVVLLGDSPQ
jgi:hypothetical protein